MACDLDNLLRMSIADVIDQTTVSDILSSPPFLQVDGLFNTRDVSDGTHTALRKGFIFRSGSLENITDRGKDELKNLGIKTIIDLRSAGEISAFPEPEIDGIELVAAQTETDPLELVKFQSVRNLGFDFLFQKT